MADNSVIIRTNQRNIVGHDSAGEAGSVVGWAVVDHTSMRFANFQSPHTNQIISGLCVQLVGEDSESWINKGGRWERMKSWMKKAYLGKRETEAGDAPQPLGAPAGDVESV